MAATIAACGDGELSGIAEKVTNPFGSGGSGGGGGGGGSNSVTVKVGDHAALANVGELFHVPSTAVAVKRTGPTAFEALFMACTHAGCLCIIESNAFKCPCHFSEFDNDGKVTAGPATSDLAQLTTSYDVATDILTVS